MPIDVASFEEYSAAIDRRLHDRLVSHLLQHVRAGQLQEDLCFALWRPSIGSQRFSALVFDCIMPEDGERLLRGNVCFTSEYLERATRIAAERDAGLALLHNHLGPGWQGMSLDDIEAERQRAAFVLAATHLPLLGLTVGTDEAWSARFWPRTAARCYERKWCSTVRVIGQQLAVTFHPDLRPPPDYRDELRRTVSVWGEKAQIQLVRTHVGIVGLGSVGRLVSESLARMGFERVSLIDFDVVEPHNLDRLLGAGTRDAQLRRLKVDVANEGFRAASTTATTNVRAIPRSLVEEKGFRAALDCDVLFSCVDRPWPRRILNHIAYAHLIPVIDGGIIVRMKQSRFRGAEWSVRTAGPGRACLACSGTFDPSLVDLERRGLLDDSSYLQGLDADHALRRNENVFMFSMSLAAHEVMHLVGLVTGILGIHNLGDQRYHYNLRQMLVHDSTCIVGCESDGLVATGDSVYPPESLLRHRDGSLPPLASPCE
ncbi:MAG: ThiF family adenylyltransferase [Phycisphaerae bacterium]|nr:ThiF family adenylyltransferase [Planctomycetia bacterium]MCL4719405.1 ThiF family adenylyltransferase [Phycisphaerae bacterium]